MPMARARFSAKLPTLESIFITLGLWVTQEYTQRRNRRILSPLQKEVCIYKQPNLYIKIYLGNWLRDLYLQVSVNSKEIQTF